MKQSKSRNPFQSPAATDSAGPASIDSHAKDAAIRKSLLIGIATLAIVFATFCASVLLIVAGIDPELAGNLWVLVAVLVSGVGSTLGFFAAFAKGKAKSRLTATMCFALITNTIMMLFAVYGVVFASYEFGTFLFRMWQND